MTYDNQMGSTGGQVVSAMFDSQADAQRAVDRLAAAGISSDRIRMVAGGSDRGTTAADEDKGFWETLGDFFFPEEDRYAYAEGLSRGSCLVTVTGLNGAEYDTALDILDDEGSIDLDERVESWRSEGWGGYETSRYATDGARSDAGMTSDRSERRLDGDDESIPVVEERLRVGKRDASHGRVRVRAYTVEEPVSETVELRDDRVEIERRPVDRPASSADGAFQDRVIEAEERREEAVVEKEARVVEEIGIRKTSETHRETISDTVRRTEVEVEDDRDDLNPSRR